MSSTKIDILVPTRITDPSQKIHFRMVAPLVRAAERRHITLRVGAANTPIQQMQTSFLGITQLDIKAPHQVILHLTGFPSSIEAFFGDVSAHLEPIFPRPWENEP